MFLISGILGYGVNAVRHFRTQMFISISVALVAAAACGVCPAVAFNRGRNRNHYDRCFSSGGKCAAVIFYALRSRSKRGNA